jgi:hypothetical protein
MANPLFIERLREEHEEKVRHVSNQWIRESLSIIRQIVFLRRPVLSIHLRLLDKSILESFVKGHSKEEFL